MGNQASNLNYIASATNELEDKIRNFEIDVLLKSNKDQSEKSFSSIYSQICLDSELFQGKNQENLEKFLKNNFSEKMADFITSKPYFKIENSEEFDMRKIRLLLFLLTFNSNVSVNNTVNSDKVIIYLIKFYLFSGFIFILNH